MPKFTIQETCTFIVEAESIEKAKDYWLNNEDNIFDVMKRTFCDVKSRYIEPSDPGQADEAEEF